MRLEISWYVRCFVNSRLNEQRAGGTAANQVAAAKAANAGIYEAVCRVFLAKDFEKFGLAVALVAFAGGGSYAQTNVTPAQYLASQPKPIFASSYRLPHLTRWGWQLSSNACVELARNWGYTLDLNWAQVAAVNLQNSNSMESGFVRLAKSYPSTYALSVLVNRSFPAPIPSGFYCTNSAGQFLTNGLNTLTVCPEGPDNYWTNSTEFWARDLRAIRSNAPIAIVLNGGEYGLDVPGFGQSAWLQDPRVLGATNGLSIPRYASNRKAHQLGFLTAAIRRALPDRELYIFYNTGNEQNRYTALKDWFNVYDNWGWNSDVMVTNTDLPSFEDYYGSGGWLRITNPFPNDILTRHLNAVGYNLKLGYKTNYTWVCAGWDRSNGTNDFSDIPHYMGFLKCLYTGGMVGAVASYFTNPPGGFDVSFPTNDPPQWLLQIIALARVHGLFSHLDNFVYNGDLISGPQNHSMSADQPAYEFTNTTADATARVMARALPNTNQWLITAWASDGPDRNVTVTIPVLGSVQVLARASGTVYTASRY